jgi:hypothetical protein
MGHLPKIIESQDYGSPKQMRTRTKKACQGDIANKKPKEQLLGWAFHYSATEPDLQHNNFNKK